MGCYIFKRKIIEVKSLTTGGGHKKVAPIKIGPPWS